MVDNFNEGGVDMVVNNTYTSTNRTETGLNTTNTIGGERYSSLVWEEGSEDTTLKINQSGDSSEICTYSSQPSNNGYFELIYGQSTDLNTDFTDSGSNNRFGFYFSFSDVVGTMYLTVEDGDNDFSTVSKALPVGGVQNDWVYMPFNSFTNNINFQDIDQVRLRVDGSAGSDIEIDVFQADVIPEPATMASFLLGIVGACYLRRIKRKS
jgi:hypothetical protein